MSDERGEQKNGYCNWCDTITNSIVKSYENGRLVWTGCPDCFVKKKRLAKKDVIGDRE